MGTMVDWMEVVGAGGAWGSLMFIFGLISKDRYKGTDIVALVFGSLLFGMLTPFGWHRLL